MCSARDPRICRARGQVPVVGAVPSLPNMTDSFTRKVLERSRTLLDTHVEFESWLLPRHVGPDDYTQIETANLQIPLHFASHTLLQARNNAMQKLVAGGISCRACCKIGHILNTSPLSV